MTVNIDFTSGSEWWERLSPYQLIKHKGFGNVVYLPAEEDVLCEIIRVVDACDNRGHFFVSVKDCEIPTISRWEFNKWADENFIQQTPSSSTGDMDIPIAGTTTTGSNIMFGIDEPNENYGMLYNGYWPGGGNTA